MPGVSYTENLITRPIWMMDYTSRDHLVLGPLELNPDAFQSSDAILAKASAAAAVGATAISVDALSGPIPAGKFLNFGTYAPVTVKLGAAAAQGAVALTTDALSGPVPAGAILNFGNLAQVTVTVNDADVNATETAITVAALSGPIPAGTVLEFSGSGAGFAKLSAAAAQGATSLVVEALAQDIDNAATAVFEGGDQIARVTTAAITGATTIAVEDLPLGIADDSEALFAGGTIQARLTTAAADGATSLVVDELQFADSETDPSFTGVRPGSRVAENFLPDQASYSDAAKLAALRAAYQTMIAPN
jgi:hypothetical protein